MNKWSFDDQDNWIQFSNCNRNSQSPINISTESVVKCDTLCKLALKYKGSRCKISNQNNLIKLKYDKGSYIKFKDELYFLDYLTIHSPSLHKINGESQDLEICLYHNFGNKSNQNNDNNGVIMCMLYRRGPNSGKCNMFMNDFINDIPTKNNLNEVDIPVWKNWSAELLLPQKKSFFLYDGSIPYPPCDEKYKVIVFDEIGNIGGAILDNFKYNVGENSRMIKPLGDRIIYYNVNSKIGNLENKPKLNFDIIKDDKYLRCVKINKLKALKNKKPKKVKKKKYVDSDMSAEEQRKIRNNLLLAVIILLFINCLFIVKWLYKHEYMINFLNKLGGKLVGGTISKKTLFNINQMVN